MYEMSACDPNAITDKAKHIRPYKESSWDVLFCWRADFQEKPPFEMVDRDKRASYDDRPPVVHSQSRFKRSDSETDFNGNS